MEPMNIKEAVAWAEDNKKPICRPNWINSNYLIPNEEGELVWNNGSIGNIFLTEDFTATDWQPWEEPREYFTFLDAMTLMNDESNELKYDMPGFEDIIFYGKNGMPRFRYPHVEYVATFSSKHHKRKWYIANKQPIDPENDSDDENKEPEPSKCPECSRSTQWDGEKYFCAHCGVSWPEEDAKPVFDLTYDEALKLADKDHNINVQCDAFVNGMYWCRDFGEWFDMDRVKIHDVMGWLKNRKWSIV
jgi:hypothetical protein